MIKKKIFAGFASAAMVASMLPMTAFAAAPEWGANGSSTELTGNSAAVNPVVEVALPEDHTFMLNPFSLDVDEDGTKDSQIWTQNYAITNMSQIPIEVTVKTSAVGDPITAISSLKWDTEVATELITTDQSKSVMLVQQFAKTVRVGEAGFEYDYEPMTFGTGNVVDADTAKAKGAFILQTETQVAAGSVIKLQLQGASAPGLAEADLVKCSTAFQLTGAVSADTTDPYATDDVKIKVTYTMDYLTENMYANDYAAGDTLTGVANHFKPKS